MKPRERPRRRAVPGFLHGIAVFLTALAPALGAALRPQQLASAARTASRAPAERDAGAVKAAFIYNFAARHVKWPDSAHEDKRSAFVIGVFGRDPIQGPLEETCKGRKTGDHGIRVRMLDTAAEAATCHILFLPEGREADLPAILSACKGRSTLIVSDSEAGVAHGAHVGFFLEKSKLRFAVDPETAKGAGLAISSELLKLARIVKKRSGDLR